MANQIITLTTDMGLRDYYVAALKGKILNAIPTCQIVDISHNVPPFSIRHAAHLIRNCMNEFPVGTIHVIGVDAEPFINFSRPEENIYPTIVRYKKNYFISADNGFFGLLLKGNPPDEIWRMEEVLSRPEKMNFATKNILIPAACKVASGESLDSFCTAVDTFKQAFPLSPVIDQNTLRGTVTHVDHYGNIMTNISRDDFERAGKDIPFIIYLRKKEYYIDTIANGYNDVPKGEKVALFNDSGFLEIAINKGTPDNGGGANSLLGLRIGDIIRIEYTPQGSRDTIASLF